MSTDQNGYSYTLTRTLDAPASRVWQAWTTPDQYAQWAYAVPGSVEMDVRPGGIWKATVRTPEGAEFPLTGSYLEVAAPHRLTLGMDVPGRPDPATMTLELTEQGPATRSSPSARPATRQRNGTARSRAAGCSLTG
ncbi:SRPBCC family protein [Streptomyces coelicoflavus]|uniref:SRPBCC family protein n=1 Tax=Streptomyces coelicoflavus TaxID=285562 RepID=UPI0036CB0F08